MPLTPGTRLGPYEIVSALGQGGMGEVYRAHDARLDRTVAVKVLPAHVAHDTEVRERFEREARTLAALSHPHICPVFDVGQQDGVDFLVMEYLEGETLAQRIVRQPLPLDHCLRIGIQIADALDKAHRTGIVHRDVKPGNIMLTRSGAKLLDFGLAKLHPTISAVTGLSVAKTVSTPVTGQGTILGTLHYMAPEQIEGQEVDARSDLFAFGAVLYEMVTGKKAFEGKSGASVMAAILERDPPALSTLQPLAPHALDHVVNQCLAKDPDERWQSAGDVMRELQWITNSGSGTNASAPTDEQPAGKERLAWAVALAVMSVAAVIFGFSAFRAEPESPETHLEIATPATSDPITFAISPDGRKIVFAASSDEQPRLWLRSLDSGITRALPGTDRGRVPFWSPDSRSIGFFADGTFKRLDIDTGLVKELFKAVTSTGGTWNADGVILLAMGNVQPIWRVSADGGEPLQVTKNAAGISHRTPRFLPDGRHFLYSAAGSPDTRGIYVAALDGSDSRRLLEVESAAAYSAGHLFYVLQDTLVARPFDSISLSFTGEPVRVAEGVAAFSVSAGGTITYRAGPNTGTNPAGARQLAWFDRSGRLLERVSVEQSGPPTLSPDGRRILLMRANDIWSLETTREAMERLTTNPGTDSFAVWSPDGKDIAFQSYQKGLAGEIYRKPAAGGVEERILTTPDVTHPMDWSPDGRFVLYRTQPQGSNTLQWNLWAVPVQRDGKPFAVVQSDFDERDGQFSPDGKWIAFESNETGRYEIYVQPFPTGAKSIVSSGGGAQVRWHRNGRELFYIAMDGQLMSVSIRLGNGEAEIGRAAPLFRTNVGGAVALGVARQQYAVSSDGQRFLMNTVAVEANASPISLILGWRGRDVRRRGD